jgi:hypothetical protein
MKQIAGIYKYENFRKGYQGIETGYDSCGETVIFDQSCIESIRSVENL